MQKKFRPFINNKLIFIQKSRIFKLYIHFQPYIHYNFQPAFKFREQMQLSQITQKQKYQPANRQDHQV